MTSISKTPASQLVEIPIDKIDRNPENPRIFFRGNELNTLQTSIKKHGVQVPISVYREGGRFVLVDGERRWRCSIKLNRKTIPALVQAKPDALGNLLLMFNIHALREQWDLLTVALKLPRIVDLIESRSGKKPTEKVIADETGLPRATIRRSRLLMEMPQEYRDRLLSDLDRPKGQQRLSEDFFIEMERALKTVERAFPKTIADKNNARDVLIEKYESGVIENLVDLRLIPKIARAGRVGSDASRAERVLRTVFSANMYSPRAAYEASVSTAYTIKDLVGRVQSLAERLEVLDFESLADDARHELVGQLQRLSRICKRLS